MSKRARFVIISLSSLVVTYALIGALLGKNDDTRKTYRNLGVYSEVLSRIKMDYVVEPDLRKTTRGALRGLLESLDPYNTYFTAEEYRAYDQNKSGGPANLGLILWKRGYAAVISVVPGSPADKAGLARGDMIETIDRASTRQLSLVQVMRLLQGPEGSEVNLVIIRQDRGESQQLSLVRSKIQYPPVTTQWVKQGVAYLRVPSLEKGKAAEIRTKLKALIDGGAEKIVLDLRDCATGDSDESTEVANFFIERGLITFLEGQRFPRQESVADAGKSFCKLPLVVLINGSTAGPAEILASALMESERGKLVGQRSFGVGSVQRIIPLDDGDALLLSVAKYHSPSGIKIQDEGVKPNVEAVLEIERDTDAEKTDLNARPRLRDRFNTEDDTQLHKALEVLEESLPQAA